MINLREWALPVYTIMIQLAVGSMLILWLVYTLTIHKYGKEAADRLKQNLVETIFITIGAAMIGSHFHLSRPFFSMFAVMNFKSSWLSREIVFTIVFAAMVGMLLLLQRYRPEARPLYLAAGWGTVIMGVVTVYAMSHVYLLPTQVAWNSPTTPVAFFCATLLLGCLAITSLLLMNLYLAILREEAGLEVQQTIIKRLLVVVTFAAIGTTIVELLLYDIQINELSVGSVSARASLDLLLGLYRVLFLIRLGLLLSGVGVLAGVVLWQRITKRPLLQLMTPIYIAFLLTLTSEVLGRFLFYAVHVRTGV